GDVVRDRDGPAAGQTAQTLGERHEGRPERMHVADVAVQEEQVRGAGVVALEQARAEPARHAQRLHGSRRSRCTPSALPTATSAPSTAGEDWLPMAASGVRSTM